MTQKRSENTEQNHANMRTGNSQNVEMTWDNLAVTLRRRELKDDPQS